MGWPAAAENTVKLIDRAHNGSNATVAEKYLSYAAATIGNVATDMQILDLGKYQFPVSVNNGQEKNNCYVVSPLNAYTGYLDYELSKLNYPGLFWPLRKLTAWFGKRLVNNNIDRIIYINNWLLSTNVYPKAWEGHELDAITSMMADSYPDHAIAFRSLNSFSNSQLIYRLQSLGYIPIPSRQVYLFAGREGQQSPFLKRHNTIIDMKLLQRSAYAIIPGSELQAADYVRLEQLYNMLYLEKYSPLNPHYSADWLRYGQRDGWLELSALRSPAGRIDGIVGWFGDSDTLTAPVVGYDTSLPQSFGLYRMITQLCLQKAIAMQATLNFSSGAAHFKRLRGGRAEIEYSMVYVKHLAPQRQRVWRALGAMLRSVGIPIMQKFKL